MKFNIGPKDTINLQLSNWHKKKGIHMYKYIEKISFVSQNYNGYNHQSTTNKLDHCLVVAINKKNENECYNGMTIFTILYMSF